MLGETGLDAQRILDYVDIEFKDKDEFYSILKNIDDFNKENIKVTFEKRQKDYDVIETVEEEDLEETLSFSAAKREEERKKAEKKAEKEKKKNK